MQILRSVLAVIVGLVLISAIVELLEFVVVTVLNGGVTTDPDLYFSIRNRPDVLAAKVGYNTAAAILGGWVCALIARRAPVAHGMALAAIQTVAFGWALATPALRQSTPDWMWACLIVLTFAGIAVGAALQARRTTSDTPRQVSRPARV